MLGLENLYAFIYIFLHSTIILLVSPAWQALFWHLGMQINLFFFFRLIPERGVPELAR